MKRSRLWLLSLVLLLLRMDAREVDIRLWISGGMQGIVMGSRECPGWLSVARQLEVEDPGGCWIQLGALPFTGAIEGLKQPDAVIPTEGDFRLQGLPWMEESPAPWSLLNAKALPQFPDYTPAFPPVQIWHQADGVEVHIFGLLSDKAPLRIPPNRIRPLQVTAALASLRQYLTEHPLPENAFPVLVLPEDADPGQWSKWLPEFRLLIQSAGSSAKVIALQNGAQLRVQPARFGRAIIRVQVYWDTVEKRFRNPTAESVWVQSPDLHGVALPRGVVERIRPVEKSDAGDWTDKLMTYGDAALLPEVQTHPIDSKLPDALRVSAFPEDHAWMKVRVSVDQWKRWKQAWQSPSFDILTDRGGEVEVLLPAEAAAGDPDSVIRKDLETMNLETEWMPFTSRDFIIATEPSLP